MLLGFCTQENHSQFLVDVSDRTANSFAAHFVCEAISAGDWLFKKSQNSGSSY